MTTLRRFAAAAAAIASVALFVGCMTGTAVDPGSDGQQVPDGGDATEIMVEGAWLDGGRMIGLVTSGSSSCVPTASEVRLEESGRLAVEFEDPEGACTMDMSPRVTSVALPDGVDPTKALDVIVTGAGYHGNVQIPGVPGLDPADTPEFAASAGWTGENGEFIILTWGSSSCAPVIAETTTTGPEAVTVEFAAEDAGKACTADMAPRTNLAFADGLKDHPNVVATLTGPDFPEQQAQILGKNHVHIPLG